MEGEGLGAGFLVGCGIGGGDLVGVVFGGFGQRVLVAESVVAE